MNRQDYDDVRHDNYEIMKRKSISGSRSSRKDSKKITMKYSDYIKRMKVLVGATAIVASLAITFAKTIHTELLDKITIIKLADEFNEDILSPETHRTDDNENYFYDYNEIARKIEEYEDFDEALYLLNFNIGDSQTDQVLANTGYGDFSTYKTAKGYKDTKDFKEDMSKRVLLSNEIRTKEKKLRLMQEEHKSNENSATYGGKR